MNDTERILAAIGKVDTKLTEVTARMDGIEKRVSAVEESTARKIRYQSEEIESLRRKVGLRQPRCAFAGTQYPQPPPVRGLCARLRRLWRKQTEL